MGFSKSKPGKQLGVSNPLIISFLLGLSILILVAGGALQWRLEGLSRQPRSVSDLATERDLVNRLRQSANALLNTNDETSQEEQFDKINKIVAKWQENADSLQAAIESGNMPSPIKEAYVRRVRPNYKHLIGAYLEIKQSPDERDLEELKPQIEKLKAQASHYLFDLDHLDLILSEKASDQIESLKWVEGVIIIIAGFALFSSCIFLYWPTWRKYKKVDDQMDSIKTELKKRERRVKDLESLINERLQVALDASQTGTYVWNRRKDELSWDQNMAQLYGLKNANGIKGVSDFLAFVHEDDKAILEEHIEMLLGEGEHAIKFRIIIDGKIRWIRDHSLVIDESGPVVVGACTDETELMFEIESARRSKERAELANRAKVEFIAGISHDMRTPLSAIMGFAEVILNNGSLVEAQKDRYLKMVIKNGHALLRFVDDLIDTSRIESGREEVAHHTFEVHSLLEDLQETSLKSLQKKGLEFETQIETKMPKKLKGDSILISRVLSNLISNAIRYSEKGKITVKVSLDKIKELGLANLKFLVTDQGRGIAKSRQTKIFEAFTLREQLDDSHRSTGLGLYIARKLAQLMGGRLKLIKSVPGQGSTFSLEVPVEIVRNGSSDQQIPGNGQSDVDISNLSVLMVEDSHDMRLLISTYLSLWGISPDMCSSGEEALEILKDKTYDVVLMDVGLPGIDGIETVKALRKRKYTGSVIAVSAHAMTAEKERALTAGCNLYLTKPLTQEQLYKTLQQFAASRAS